MFTLDFPYFHIKVNVEVSLGAGASSMAVNTKCTRLVVGSVHTRENEKFRYLHLYFHLFALVSRQSAALSSATQYLMLPELGEKWGTKCLKTSFPLPTLLCAGYSVKLIEFLLFYHSQRRTHDHRYGSHERIISHI